MSQVSQVRTYDRAASVVFLKTNERFGGLSNMAPGFPVRVNGVHIRTSEALYQACRFPHLPDVQRKIIDEYSPMTAKMRSKPFRNDSRPDWDTVRVRIMKWCLRVKLAHHWSCFGKLLLDTGDRPIVEQSRKDDFWGAKIDDDGKLVGMNVLGRLLMELREEIKSGVRERSTDIFPLKIPDFLLFKQSIEPVIFTNNYVVANRMRDLSQIYFREIPVPVESSQRSFFEEGNDRKEARFLLNQNDVQSPAPSTHPQTVDELRPYAEMKPSGLPWLGDVPTHWDVRRNGRLFGSRRETGFPDLPVLEVSLRSGVRVRDFETGTRKQEMGDRSKYQRAVRGDIAYNMMRMWQGAVGIAPVDGLVSPAYVVARPFAESDAAYYAYLFRTAAYMREVDTFSRGIVPDRNRLYWESFKQMPSVYPPLDEQRLIVRFLDWHGAQTAKLIRAKKTIIALLNEQKQAIIHRAVTRGLDPDVRLKPSGIPWLGDVPEGWEVKALKRITLSRCDGPFGSGLKSSHYSESGILVVRLQNIGLGIFERRDEAYISEEHYSTLGDHSVLPGDVIVASLGDERRPCGRACVAPDDLGDAMVKADCFRFRLSTEVASPSFIAAHLTATAAESSTVLSAGATRLRVNLDATAQRAVAHPTIEDQVQIVRWIESATERIDSDIASVQLEIALIQEFRTRLIADVVTGKLDVRAVAASLPETSEAEPTDDLAEDDDLDDAVDDGMSEDVAA